MGPETCIINSDIAAGDSGLTWMQKCRIIMLFLCPQTAKNESQTLEKLLVATRVIGVGPSPKALAFLL